MGTKGQVMDNLTHQRYSVDSAGNVYVADTGNNRIQKFTSNGTFITTWGSYRSVEMDNLLTKRYCY